MKERRERRREPMPEVGGRVFWLGCFSNFLGFLIGEDESGEE